MHSTDVIFTKVLRLLPPLGNALARGPLKHCASKCSRGSGRDSQFVTLHQCGCRVSRHMLGMDFGGSCKTVASHNESVVFEEVACSIQYNLQHPPIHPRNVKCRASFASYFEGIGGKWRRLGDISATPKPYSATILRKADGPRHAAASCTVERYDTKRKLHPAATSLPPPSLLRQYLPTPPFLDPSPICAPPPLPSLSHPTSSQAPTPSTSSKDETESRPQ